MECPCPLCHEPHGIEVPELVGRLAADRPARLCALRRLGLALDGSVAGASDSSAAACAVRNAVRAALEAEEEPEMVHAFELLAVAEPADEPWLSAEEAGRLAPSLLKELGRWQRPLRLGPLAALLLRWTQAGHVDASSAVTFALKVLRSLCEMERTAPPRPSEERAQFLARVSQLARLGFARITKTAEVALYLKSLHHFCAANMGSESQAIALEILAFLCGRDSDLCVDCAEIKEKYPLLELWSLMAEAAQEMGEVNSSHVVPWEYWVIPLLKETKARHTAQLDAVGFVAACVESEPRVAKHGALLAALEELCRSTSSEEVRDFATATGQRVYQIFREPIESSAPKTSAGTVSTAALALCKRMLDKDEMTRPTAHECLRHPWLTGGFDPSPEMPLLPETFSALMQSHAQSKFFQVLMNVVASEIKVGRLRLVREAFTRLDPSGSGYISAQSLEVVFKELAVSAQTCEQALRALDVAGTGQIPYTLFIAGCVDLVDDKLDHMLWKVFGMVDEDFSGEIETV
ncbi:unnamed protein product, partial [Effrenium voratum]